MSDSVGGNWGNKIEPGSNPISWHIYTVQWEVVFGHFVEDHLFESHNN